MLNISTKSKIRLAKIANNLSKSYEKLKGSDYNQLICSRKGIKWQLDLDEGIDYYIYLFGTYEYNSYAAYRKIINPDSTVIDIGANIDGHSLQIASLLGDRGEIHAIEPTNWAFDKLKKNVSLNEVLAKRIKMHQAILTDESKENKIPQKLYSSWSFDSKKKKHAILRGSLNTISGAFQIRLDDLVEQNQIKQLDFIKIDVDGYKCKVIRSGMNILKTFKPTMLVEFCPYLLQERGDSLEEYPNLLDTLGYRLYSGTKHKPLPISARELIKYIPHGGGINAIAKAH